MNYLLWKTFAKITIKNLWFEQKIYEHLLKVSISSNQFIVLVILILYNEQLTLNVVSRLPELGMFYPTSQKNNKC